uniref:Nuclear pore complex protein Nup153 n=1 Tax=Amphimedon queenslandica TaxID=400682 RepID=A0A1X7UQL4_AMPQE
MAIGERQEFPEHTKSSSLSFKAQPVSLPPPSSVPPAPPALSKPAGSLVDALKKPEYQIENIRKEAKQKSVLAPSTASLVGGETKGLSVPPLKPLKDVPLIVPTSNWSCDSCWVSNKSDTNKCMACGASQPSGIRKKAVAFSTPSVTDAPSGGLKFPSGGSLTSTSGGLKLPTGGSLTSTSGGLKLPTGGSLIGTSGGSKLPTGNLTGEVKLPQGGNVMLAPSGRIFSSSGPPSSASTSTNIASSSGSGFKLSSGGLSNVQPPTLVTPNTKSTVVPLSSLAPPTSNWECPVCMISNTKDSDTCVACGAKRSSGTSIDNKGSGTGFLKPGGKWECPTCMLLNDPSKDSCPACETPRPGATAKTSQTSLNSSVKPVQFGDGGGMKLGGGGGGLLLTGTSGKPTLQIASGGGLKLGGGGLKLGGGGLNIFGGISSQSQSVSTNNTNTSQSVTLGVTTQSTTTSSSQTNVSVSSFIPPNVTTGSSLLSSSSLPTAPSLLPPAATKPSLFGQSLVTAAPSPLSTASSATPPLSLGGSVSLSSGLTSTTGTPLFMQSQQPVSGPSTTFTLPKSDFNKGALSGLKFETPPPPVLTTASSEGSTQSQPISVTPSSGFSTLPTTSVGASLFQSFLTPPASAPASTATVFGKPPGGGGDGQKLLFGVPSQ